MAKEYAVYKGEELICMGTSEYCADEMGVKLQTFKFYLTPSYRKRMLLSKTNNILAIVKLDDEDEV